MDWIGLLQISPKTYTLCLVGYKGVNRGTQLDWIGLLQISLKTYTLCLAGYKGVNYNEKYNQLRTN